MNDLLLWEEGTALAGKQFVYSSSRFKYSLCKLSVDMCVRESENIC